MKLTDTGLPDQLAREILPPGTDPKTINKLSQQMAWAWKKGKIPTSTVWLKKPRYNRYLDLHTEVTEEQHRIALGDAAEWARDNGFAVRDEILENLPPDATPSPPPGRGGKWPWGDYETPLLQILAEAVNHFCLAGDYPKKGGREVAEWVKKRMEQDGLPSSDALADKIETIISPRPYSHHRQRKPR